jgi:hypothetical protein
MVHGLMMCNMVIPVIKMERVLLTLGINLIYYKRLKLKDLAMSLIP